MNTTEEKGITVITLITTIVILLILASIGVTSGMSTIKSMNFSEFKSELKILQTKVNELNQNNKLEIGQELTEEQKNIFNITTISNIIFKDKSEEEKTKIQNGFKYCDIDYIKNDFELGSIKRDYIINVEYRYVICYDGFSYKGTTYYMVNQLENEIYNVNYNDKNEKTGSFEVNYTKESDRWKIEVSNIEYNGYINNWEVKYRLEGESYWKTANNLSFYVTKEGNYYVQLVHGDDINLGSKLICVIDEENTTNENVVE